MSQQQVQRQRAFRVCPDCGVELPRRGNKPAERCRKCNCKAMRKRLKEKRRREKTR